MNTKAENKICIDCEIEFIVNSDDLVLYEKIGLKSPDQCFKCRIKQYSAFWVFGKFRKGVSDLSGGNLITVLPLKPRYPVYTSKEWWSDNWDPIIHGVDYDPTQSFFSQLEKLQEKIPRPHQVGENNVNCDWSDDVWDSKNCYLSRSLDKCENLNYCYRTLGSKDSVDLAFSFNLQGSYDCLTCYNSFNLNFSENSKDCIDSYFLFDCRNCQDCFMSYNLRNKQFCIRNKQYAKDKYFQEIAQIKLNSYKNVQSLKNEFENLVKNEAIHRENFNLKTTNSVGNYLLNCDKCVNVFTWDNSQNCRNSLRGLNAKDCIDQLGSWYTEACGNNSCVTGGYGLRHSSWSDARYSEYLDLCIECEYCFGCVGLRKKKYCILNTQYSKEEYENLKSKIINDVEKRGEYGKFLPYSMGLCPYNLSGGSIYFPETTREEIVKHGGYWSIEDLSSGDGVSSLELPDSINDTDKNISSQALICLESKYRFNIAPSEYDFHKNKNFALPRLHFDLRMLKKAKKLTVIEIYTHSCIFCARNIMTYCPTHWGYKKIACEDCYKQRIF